MINTDFYVIELLVRNHPGVMCHITGLFARRAYNLDGILCGEVGDGSTSKIYLLVKNDHVLTQMINQIKKLHDILEVEVYQDYDINVFKNLDKVLRI